MELKWIDGSYTVCKLPGSALPTGLGEPVFFAKTDCESSLVCQTHLTPEDTLAREDGWCMLRIEGQLDFSLTGILARLSAVLAAREIGIFAVSTFDTDYILVKSTDQLPAQKALEAAGYSFG